MISPGQYDIVIQSNSDFDMAFQLKDSTGTGIDLSASTVEAEIWSDGKRFKMADFTVTKTNAAIGQFTISLTEAQTAALTESGYYDIRVTSGSSSYYWVRGEARLETGYTE